MKKKFFTIEEKRIGKNLQQQKYYNKIKKPKPTYEELMKIKEEKLEKRKKYVKNYYLNNKEKSKEYSNKYFLEHK